MYKWTARDYAGKLITKSIPGAKVFSAGGVALVRQRGHFVVVYGLSVKGPFDYTEAAHELGLALMHQIACEGPLDGLR